MINKNFILFSDCIPVKGANRSIICDTRNNKYFFIPNGLFDILEKFNGRSIDFVKKEFKNNYDTIIEEYFNFLYSSNLIFFNSNPDFFPKINLKWNTPSIITNMIIDYEDIEHDFNNIIQQLEELKCSYIQLRFFKETSLNFLKKKLFTLSIKINQE